ncbi:MAG TPA: alkaline phosphatase PhoX [Polyangiaceae bacterium]|nr:alkaline phosphatase PhoX [Polyangiaceae bacterium]
MLVQNYNRRSFIRSGAIVIAATGSLASVIGAVSPAAARGRRLQKPFRGYGPLVPDPKGVLDLPRGFHYTVFSSAGDILSSGGLVPSSHDGMAAFDAPWGTWLVRNHELSSEDVEEDGLVPVAHVPGATYDAEAVGGTTTLLVRPNRQLAHHQVSLAGTSTNCAGGPTPWGTWLTCEETDEVLDKPHGYVFEVSPSLGGNPVPIIGMGRFEHEAVAIDQRGTAYLTEDADGPFGCVYRYLPRRPRGGLGSLHAGGRLEALRAVGVDTDLSIIQTPGSVLELEWVEVPNPDPGADDTPVREQVIARGATPIPKCEGAWTDADGNVWFVASRGDGPDAEDEDDRSAALHSGQIWKIDPRSGSMELVVLFEHGDDYDGPDNITVGPHGFALACTDGEDDQYIVAVTEDGSVHPFAYNPFSDDEFAGATFSPDGQTLFVNIQGNPALTFAIWGPWKRD